MSSPQPEYPDGLGSLCLVHLDLSHSLCSGSVCPFVLHRPLDACILFRLCPSMSFLPILSGAWTGRRGSVSVGEKVGT